MDVQEVLDRAREIFSSQVVVGEPIERDGVTVIPAARVRGGGGGGSGSGADGSGGGGGFGLQAHPVGAWVVHGDEVRWEPAVDVTRIALAAMALVALALLRLGR